MNANLFALLAARFPADRSAPFILRPDGRRDSYAELEAASARYAGILRAAGARPGDRVAVQVEKSPEAVFLYLACLRAGLAYLPLNSGYRRDELEYFLADAEPAVAVCAPDSPILESAAPARFGARLFTLDARGEGTLAAAPASEAAGILPRRSADLAAILYTSGTTGRPKGAMITHGNLASNALVLAAAWGFGPEDRLLHALPIFHTHGLFVAINTTLASGAAMIFLPRFDAAEVIRRLPEATVMMGVPTFYVRLLAAPGFTREACRGVRLFISGSAPLSPETFASFRERTGFAILERYGMTETNMLTSNPLQGERVAGSVGPPLPGVELRIVGPEGEALPQGAVGEIEVKGPSVFTGYWRDPEKTAQAFRADGFFRTGDLGRLDDKGYLFIVGRAKDLIISGGFNVYPKEVETVIDAIPGVAESAVIGVPHPDFGEAVVAVVTPRPGAGDGLTPEAIIGETKRRLAAYKAPKAVVILDRIPRNVMGKVEKNRLRQLYRDLFA